ncbi:MAG: (2Fe-2S)-binding protein [Lentisphaerae bacterium]|jgi:predicted molibdopterin-dependent oxidoreductase YjgC|nr:(2Fe-2S)-binding protein [Lentisphaerota bacterium]MBT4823245.1 (2Fe-2S)-binding protein [Lentisphaerota bacterium]MBT5604805.1 (2Fe-2S)-binding protein [Lentisphaerota bacterium]MBT7053556.1 (2Fe-2S)-binding protein [Lentisphaerota bacterium]MBT7843393.1 (2Fe-2S)-binding protein [Lentisphaerota bacterium]
MTSRRIDDHPILGASPNCREVTITVDGSPLLARDGDTIASALIAAGWTAFRHTEKRHEPRGVFCAIGKCTDCVMTVNGVPNVRTCIALVEDGMRVETQEGLGTWRVP